jgi:hypothetical protein
MAKEEYIPKKRGPKTKYTPDACKKIIEAAGKGAHVAGMCVAIGIASEDTFFRWVREIPEFAEAYKEAQLISKAFYEDQLLRGSLGLTKGFNATSMAMIMNNKFPQDYKRGTGSNTEINIGSINQVAIDPEDLDRKLEEAKAKLKALNYDPDEASVEHG